MLPVKHFLEVNTGLQFLGNHGAGLLFPSWGHQAEIAPPPPPEMENPGLGRQLAWF